MPTDPRFDHCLGDIVRRNAARFPDVPAYLADGRRITHSELHERAVTLAAALARIGLRRQDRIALLGRNSIEFGEVLAAGQLSGLVVATVNFRLAPPEIGRVLADSNPRVLFVDAEYLPAVDAMRADLDLELVVCLDATERTDVVDYHEFVASSTGADLAFAARPDDIACLIYTSGTTGGAKGCILGQRELFAGAHTMNVEMRSGSEDRVLLTMPLFHIGALAIGLGNHARGGTAVLRRKFDAADVVATVPTMGITTLHLAPTMLDAVLREAADSHALANVHTVIYSAAPITPNVLSTALSAMPDAGFLNLYGQTEVMTSGLTRELHRGESTQRERRLTSVGHPFPDTSVRIVDEHGIDCPPGTPGEVVVSSPAMFRGYWNDSVTTAKTLRDGWCHTGDIGVLDEEYLLHLVDRKKDVIISGGENIYSLEVEDAAVTHPAVAQCAVVGIADERWGESVCAIVVPVDRATIDADGLRAHIATQIARYKAPQSVVVVDELPVLPTGKVDKKSLRARYTARQQSTG